MPEEGLRSGQVEKDNVGWISDRRMVARKRQTATLAVDPKNCKVVSALIAAVKKLTARIESKTARIIASRPFICDEAQLSVLSHRENPNAVVQTVSGVNKATVT